MRGGDEKFSAETVPLVEIAGRRDAVLDPDVRELVGEYGWLAPRDCPASF